MAETTKQRRTISCMTCLVMLAFVVALQAAQALAGPDERAVVFRYYTVTGKRKEVIRCVLYKDGTSMSGRLVKRKFVSDAPKITQIKKQLKKKLTSKKRKSLLSQLKTLKAKGALCAKNKPVISVTPTPSVTPVPTPTPEPGATPIETPVPVETTTTTTTTTTSTTTSTTMVVPPTLPPVTVPKPPLSPVTGPVSESMLASLYEKAAFGALPSKNEVAQDASMLALVDQMMSNHLTKGQQDTADAIADLNLLVSRDIVSPPAAVSSYKGSLEPAQLAKSCFISGIVTERPTDLIASEYEKLFIGATERGEPVSMFSIFYRMGWDFGSGMASSTAKFKWDSPALACRNEYILSHITAALQGRLKGWKQNGRLAQILTSWKAAAAFAPGPSSLKSCTRGPCYTSVSRSSVYLFMVLQELYNIAREEIPEFEALDWRDGKIGDDVPDDLSPWHHRWGLRLLTKTPNPFQERLAWIFLHNYFALSSDKDGVGGVTDLHFYGYMGRLRDFAYSERMDFRQLLKDMCRDPAMLSWLDNSRNTNVQTNENFARELMELFSLGPKNLAGEDNYSLTDIIAASRALSGLRGAPHQQAAYDGNFYHVGQPKHIEVAGQDREKTRYEIAYLGFPFFIGREYPALHYKGPHLIFQGKPWQASVETYSDLVDSILDRHPNAPIFLARKIVEEYVNEQPAPEVVTAVAASIKANNYNLRPVFKELFASIAMQDEANRNSIRKSATERAVETVRRLAIPTVFYDLVDETLRSGHQLANPPNVFGWDPVMWTNTNWALSSRNTVQEIVNFHGMEKWPFVRFYSRFSWEPWTKADPQAFTDIILMHFGMADAQPALKARIVSALNGVTQKDSGITWSQVANEQVGDAATRKAQRINEALSQIFDLVNLMPQPSASASETLSALKVKLNVSLNAEQEEIILKQMQSPALWDPADVFRTREKIRMALALLLATNDFGLR